MATKTKKTAARKTAAKKTAAKKAPARKSTAKKTTVKSTATKKAAKKAPAKKKTAAKKAAPKKTATKKTAAKKATVKTSAKKKATVKTTATKKKAARKATVKTTAKKAEPKKTAAKKATVKTTATKKTAAKKAAPAKTKTKAALKEEAAHKPKKPANVGQAPRKTTLAASIPTPSTIIPKDAPQADKEASEDVQASKSAKQDFKVKDKIVYPAHGVGTIISLEKQQVAGIPIELFVIDFDQEKMKLRVPTGKAKAAGMRPLSDDKTVKDAISTLKGRARIKRTMWSRRAQEYDAKINSGDIKLVAEVVRDLYRGDDQPEQSYSERQLFEAALDRMAREVAAVRNVDLGKAIEELEGVLKKKAGGSSAASPAAS